jgi:iron complex outermembrane recepter protein
MKNRTNKLVMLACVFAFLLLQITAYAQNAPDVKPDDVVQLSAFSVSSGSERGYIASESMSGSRVATAIKDLPFDVSVVTSEFMKDFGAFEGNTDSFAYTSGVTAVDLSGTGNSTIRGYASQYMLRDGFFRLGRTDPILIDRVEFIKGPNVSSIYGETQPGGIINMITKRPSMNPSANLSLMFGSYGNDREDFTITGPLRGLKNTSYLVVGSDFERHYQVRGATLRNRSFAIGVDHKFDSGGDLNILTSTWRGQGHTAMSNVPYFYDSVNKVYTGVDMDLANLNQNGPSSEVTREASDLTGTYEQRLNSVFSLRVGSNWWHSKKWNFANSSGTQYDYINNKITRGSPSKGLINEDGGGLQVDLVADSRLFSNLAHNKTLITFDFSDYYRYQPTWTLNSSAQVSNTVASVPQGALGTYWFKYIYPSQAPIDYSVPVFGPQYYTYSVNMKNRASIWGGLLRDQIGFWNDRLLLFGTLRYDDVKLNLHSYIGSGIVANGSQTAVSPSLGANYKITPAISAYASWSVGFNANAQNQTATNIPSIQPNQRSRGYDYGIKANLIGEKLFLTLGGYYTILKNVPDTELLPNGTTITNFTGSELARGVDLDLTYRATDNLTLIGGYGQNATIYTYYGRDIGAVGHAPKLVPPNQGGLAFKYVFSGSLKSYTVNGGVTYTDKAPSENPNTGDLFSSTGVYTGNDGRRNILLPSYTLFNLAFHYRFPTKLRQNINVFFKNISNKEYIAYLQATLTRADGRGVYVSYDLGY